MPTQGQGQEQEQRVEPPCICLDQQALVLVEHIFFFFKTGPQVVQTDLESAGRP